MQNTIENTTQIVSTTNLSAFIRNTFNWMTAGLCVTAIVAAIVTMNTAFANFVFGNTWVFFVLALAEIGLVYYISARISTMTLDRARYAFLGYAILNGITLSMIFVLFTLGSIATVFFITAGTFAAMSLYGYTTKTDLSKVGNIALMALVGMIIATIVNIFVQNTILYTIISYAGVFIFVALTAYDMQKLKYFASMAQNGEQAGKYAVLGALTLYLDFINLFLSLLRILGRSR